MRDLVVVTIGSDGRARTEWQLEGRPPGPVEPLVTPIAPTLTDVDLEELRWYLEDYLRAPYGAWEKRATRTSADVGTWGRWLFEDLFSTPEAVRIHTSVRERSTRGGRPRLLIRSAEPRWLAVPWELAVDPSTAGPAVPENLSISRALPGGGTGPALEVDTERLRMLMVIARPGGSTDVGYRTVGRPLQEVLGARGNRPAELTVLRPPTFAALEETLAAARDAGDPFHLVHFDGHGAAGGPTGESVLLFEDLCGRPHRVPAAHVARVLAASRTLVVVLNSCESGAMGKDLESAMAIRLLADGAVASVVAMAYTVHPVAVTEFVAGFYEHMFDGGTTADAVSAGRRRLVRETRRPSPRGPLPLQDWVVPVHYVARDVRFPRLRTDRPGHGPEVRSVPDGWAAVGTFVGRDALFQALEATTAGGRVAMLHGSAGIGKSELARAFGRWMHDTSGHGEPFRLVWHSCPADGAVGVAALVADIGVQARGAEFEPGDPDRSRKAALAHVGLPRSLLVIDGVGPAPDHRGLLEFATEVAEAGARVVLTGRAPWPPGPGVEPIAVSGLNPGESAEYADSLVGGVPSALDAMRDPTFAELVEWLGGHPLGMRLTLPRLAGTPPAELLATLRGAAPAPGSVADDKGEGVLAASIAASIAALPERTRRLLTAVCLFDDVVDATVLVVFSTVPGVPERFAGADVSDWMTALETAATAGLLNPVRTAAYAVHPALPGHMSARWRADDGAAHPRRRAAAEIAFLDACKSLGAWLDSQIQEGEAATAYTTIAQQRRTLLHALDTALHSRAWVEAYAIVVPMVAFWNARGMFTEQHEWIGRARRRVESAHGATPPLDGTAGGLWLFLVGVEANRNVLLGRLADAETVYDRTRRLLTASPASPLRDECLSVAFHGLGTVVHARGDRDRARTWFRRALEASGELDDRLGVATAHHQLATIALEQGDLDAARDHSTVSADVYAEQGNRSGVAAGLLCSARSRTPRATTTGRRPCASTRCRSTRTSWTTGPVPLPSTTCSGSRHSRAAPGTRPMTASAGPSR